MIDQQREQRRQGAAERLALGRGRLRCLGFGLGGGGFLLDLVEILLPEVDHVAQDLKVNPFIRITLVFKEQRQGDWCLCGRLGVIDQIAKVAAQLLIDKGIFRQLQLAEIDQPHQ